MPLNITRQRICGRDMEIHGPWYEQCHQQNSTRQYYHSSISASARSNPTVNMSMCEIQRVICSICTVNTVSGVARAVPLHYYCPDGGAVPQSQQRHSLLHRFREQESPARVRKDRNGLRAISDDAVRVYGGGQTWNFGQGCL